MSRLINWALHDLMLDYREIMLMGEAAALPFFSRGQYTNPMVVRIAGLGYQQGFGGHFLNGNSVAVLRDIPGLILACPSNGADAVGMLRECVRLAREEQRLVVFLEPIALYAMRDLAPGDGVWMQTYAAPGARIALGEISQSGDGTDLAIVSFASGFYLSRQAHKDLGTGIRVIDLRWLNPLPLEAMIEAVRPAGRSSLLTRPGGPGHFGDGNDGAGRSRAACRAPCERTMIRSR